jgi:hypothetical protein
MVPIVVTAPATPSTTRGPDHRDICVHNTKYIAITLIAAEIHGGDVDAGAELRAYWIIPGFVCT